MSRPWVPLGIVACSVLLAIVIAGWPDRHKDAPLSVRAASTTGVSAVTTSTVASASPPAPPTTAPTAPAPAPASVRVIAFNASAVPGSAGRVTASLKTQGYAVGPAGPDQKPVRDTSAVMYRPGFDTAAKTLAAALGIADSATQAVEAAPAGWGSADVAVVIGNDVARRV